MEELICDSDVDCRWKHKY